MEDKSVKEVDVLEASFNDLSDCPSIKEEEMPIAFVTKEIADMLRMSESKVRKLAKSGELKSFKLGRKGGFRFFKKDVHSYIKNAQNDLLLESQQ